ncbi:NEK protein kinase [Cladophialophora psammophila CBS 110553]|uniref:non-specific serine/threonine protein kinase n=1 Tax=Cladophialophora psammophila CBS 110553 TaxID=1182543 RepID=W9X4L0_9EURO|nr:NEK protein kinase [Cladophialophora psammophila CBS 110553]EXJ72265.1 NEK protein kinase [Cladophialophora psammophila CBS 110553]
MALEIADNDKYEVKEIIGRGAFGIIRKVRRKQDGHILCRKEINYLKMSQKERDQLHAEFSILASLSHPNIVGYFHREHLRQTQELYLYMEYCGGGDLGCVIKELKRKNEYAKEEFVWRIFSQLVTALYRCHYGMDPPEPGSDFSRRNDTRPLGKGKMILHRDLKPENIFLGEDQSVKLGDFGLSKIMQSHDFASTYVGTPFYMSPEICAAEKYTLYSDIWSLGCIMYELCTKEPPFNANSHLQLVQRIRKGDFKPIPAIYSKDLSNVIANCLKTNPMHRPDTSSLLTVPYVWLARRQQEMVTIGKTLRTREEIADHKVRQAEERLSALEADRAALKVEIDAQLRREWEVKARLEIDRQVQLELERLRKKFDKEVDERVAQVLVKQKFSTETRALREIQNPPGRAFDNENLNPHSSVNTSGEEDFPSTTDITDLSDLSINSPTASSTKSSKSMPKKTKTPFARSKTTFDSPVDIQMSEPSPMSISSLALSPRRNAAAQATANPTVTAVGAKNLFAEAARQKARWEPQLAYSSDEENIEPAEDSDDDGFPELASPTRLKGNVPNTDPFKNPAPLPLKNRPAMWRQNTTATMQKLIAKPTLFPSSNTAAQVRAGIASGNMANAIKAIPRNTTDGDLRATAAKPASPNRRLSKIPSRNDLREHANAEDGSTSPLRRAATTGGRLPSKLGGSRDPGAGTGIEGRTLVELAQARAGGHLNTKVKSVPEQRSEKELPPVPVWDPEIFGDEMPSPFLKKDVKSVRVLR